MNQKSGYAFRIILGGWLGYIGGSLLYQMYTERPTNMILISGIGVIFVVIGAFCVIHSLKKVYDLWKGEHPAPGINEDHPEPSGKKKKTRRSGVHPVALTYIEDTTDQEENQAEKDQTGEEHPEEVRPEEEQTAEREASPDESEETGPADADSETAAEEPDKESGSDEVPEETAEAETADRDVEILEVSEEETDNHADEIESDYEEK